MSAGYYVASVRCFHLDLIVSVDDSAGSYLRVRWGEKRYRGAVAKVSLSRYW